MADAAELALGAAHSCVRTGGGTVACWGRNDLGQLGDGSTTNRTTTVAVVGLAGAVELDAGRGHTCARVAAGIVCWGGNASGQLGNGSTVDRTTPTSPAVVSDATEISAGGFHTCARRDSDRLLCWGGNGAGELGDGTTDSRLVPTAVVGL